jgi:hypothetical protein
MTPLFRRARRRTTGCGSCVDSACSRRCVATRNALNKRIRRAAGSSNELAGTWSVIELALNRDIAFHGLA